jgi:hypothetical protein
MSALQAPRRVRRLDAGTLELGGGLEVLLQATFAGLSPGEPVEVRVGSRAVALELPSWAALHGHEVLGEHVGGAEGQTIVLRRGESRRVLAEPEAEVQAVEREPPPLCAGELRTGDMRGGGGARPPGDRGGGPPPPAQVSADGGFAPLGSVAEQGAPMLEWRLHERRRVWAPDVGELAEQASAEQWDASRAIPWEAAEGLPEPLDRAVGQVMTFIAQNEYAALYVPAAFLPQVHPAYVESLMWLASHVHDEARHVEVFTKRALMCRQGGYALASTERSLRSLLEERDFTAASLLLNVLGEGTFLDLLRFVERHAPDEASACAARLAHRDERRHVHFGVSHVRHALETEPELRGQLVRAAEQRAAKLTELSLSPLLTEGLTVMAAGSLRPAALSEGARAVRGLLARMERNRVRRLRAAGFSTAEARHISDLHTPNLM